MATQTMLAGGQRTRLACALSDVLKPSLILLALYIPCSYATDECGTGTTVICNNSGTPASNLNPYSSGVSYITRGINLTLAAGANMNVSALQRQNFAATLGNVITAVGPYGNVVLTVQPGASVTTVGSGISGATSDGSVTITNGGDITVNGALGLSGHGVSLQAFGNASVVNTGTVNVTGTLAGANGIQIQSTNAGILTIDNSGTITSAGANGVNATVNSGGAINFVQTQTGTITGGGNSGYGVGLTGGTVGATATVTGQNSGSIQGTSAGVQFVRTTGNFTNTGIIRSLGSTQTTGGIVLGTGTQMSITNEATGTITGINGLLAFAGNTGTTFTNRGTLTGTGGTAILLNGAAIANTTLIFDTGSNVTGNIQGNSLANGNNRFILEGSGNYGGNVAGMSTVSMTGTDWLLSGNIAPIDDVAGAAHVQTGRLTVTGSLSTSGSAANTLIDAGAALQIGNGGAVGEVTGSIVDNGTLSFNRSNALPYSGIISGTGSVSQLGTGTTIFTADQTYTGGTLIAAGTLQLGNGGTGGGIVGDVTNNSVLSINRSDTVTLPGLISGTGRLLQAGSGTTVLTADNTYAGGTMITNGTLQLGNGGTHGGIVGNVADNGTLVFNRADDIIFSDAISGTGGVNQLGPGTLRVNGDQTYTGPTQVLAGMLALAGSLQSTVTVSPGATLSGTGVVNGDVINQGRLWPGTAIAGATDYGSLTVRGNYVGQNGVLELNTFLGTDGSPSNRLVIDGGTGSGNTSIIVHNTATAGAATTADGILLVSAINGATTTGDAFNLAGELRSGALDYRLFRGSKDGGLPDNWYLRNEFIVPPDPDKPGEPGEPPVPPNPDDPTLPSDPPPDELDPGQYPTIGPELATYGVIQPLARELAQRTLSTLHDRNGDSALMASSQAAIDNGPSSWARVFAATVDQSYKAFAAPQSKGNLAGFQIGGDMWQGQWAPGHTDRFGGYLAYANASVDVSGLVTNASATSYDRERTGTVGLHATSAGAYWTHYGPTGWYLDGVLQASSFGGTANTAYSRLIPKGTGFLASLEFGYPMEIASMGKNFVLEPQLQAIRQYVNFSARNDGLGMVTVGSTYGSTGRIGLRGKWELTGHNGELWMPYLTVDVIRDWGARSSTVFADGNSEGSVVPLQPQASRGSLTGGVTVQWSQKLMAYAAAGYEHELGSGQNSKRQGFDANIGLRYMW
jgi:outer membrane autotransporter protein